MNFFQRIAHDFQRPKINMSSFDLSHEHKTTMQFGKLVPVLMQEILPGDKWKIDASAFVRTMPLLSPMMHKVDLKLRFFFVPNRIIWDNWERFISDGRDKNGKELYVPSISFTCVGQDEHDHMLPYTSKGTLCDYFGFDIGHYDSQDTIVSQLPFRAYDCVYREYFANQWVSSDIPIQGYDGASYYNRFGDMLDIHVGNVSDYSDLLQCEDVCWEQDYFTAASPTPMAVSTGINGLVINNGSVKAGGHPTINDGLYPTQGSTNQTPTVTELRNAYRLQEFLERTLRTGRRYAEQLMAHWGVETSDQRLQRPEYLGGGRLAVQISEVASTAEASTGHLGDLAGRGLSVGNFGSCGLTAEEHGYIVGVAYIVPHSSYTGGIPRTFLRRDRWDYAFPEFADLGEQPIWLSELDGMDNQENDPTRTIFGYVPRYSEYKFAPDKFTGDMKNTLSFWHLGRDFNGSKPALNADFVYINDKARASLNRVFGIVDPTEHPFNCTFGFQIKTLRPLPFNPQPLM